MLKLKHTAFFYKLQMLLAKLFKNNMRPEDKGPSKWSYTTIGHGMTLNLTRAYLQCTVHLGQGKIHIETCGARRRARESAHASWGGVRRRGREGAIIDRGGCARRAAGRGRPDRDPALTLRNATRTGRRTNNVILFSRIFYCFLIKYTNFRISIVIFS